MDSSDPNVDTRMDNKKGKSAQDPEKNLDLLMKTDDWAASSALSLSLYVDNKSLDFGNKRN